MSADHEALVLSLMGGWRLEVGGRLADVQLNVQRLLAFLALRGRCSRDVVSGIMWPQSPDDRAHANLRSTLWRAQRIRPGLVHECSGTLTLGSEVDLDVTRLRAHARTLIDVGVDYPVPDDGLPGVGELLALDLLPGWDDDWLVLEREHLRQLQLHALDSLARALAAAHRYFAAVDTAMTAIAAEPMRESAHRIVIDVHLAEGNVGEARRAYDALRRVLAAELGIEPSQDLTARVAAARGGLEERVVVA